MERDAGITASHEGQGNAACRKDIDAYPDETCQRPSAADIMGRLAKARSYIGQHQTTPVFVKGLYKVRSTAFWTFSIS